MKATVYARVSTTDQDTQNQLHELRRFVGQRGWELSEFVEQGMSPPAWFAGGLQR